jgi:hypothetical protein
MILTVCLIGLEVKRIVNGSAADVCGRVAIGDAIIAGKNAHTQTHSHMHTHTHTHTLTLDHAFTHLHAFPFKTENFI